MLKGHQRLLEAARRLPVGRPRAGLGAGLTQVRYGLLPHLTAHGMVGEPFDVLDQPIRIGTFDRADDAGVKLLAPLFEQRAVGHFMRERVLEGVLGIREEPRLVEELRRLQMRESTLEVTLGHLRDDVQQLDRHVLADDGRGLEQLLVVRGQPLDAGRETHLHGGRNVDGVDELGEAIRAGCSLERPRFHERLDHLLDEERIAAFDEQSRERRQRGIVAQKRAHEVTGTLGDERIEPQLAVVGLASPTMLILGPVVDQQKQPGRGQAVDQAVEHGLCLGVDPVQVFDEQQKRLNAAFIEKEALHRVLDPLAALRRIEIVPGLVIDGEVQQREKRREE